MRLIDADKAVEQINEWLDISYIQTGAIPLNISYHFELLGCIEDCPTIDAVPVVRGEWIETPTKDSVLCSYCHADWNLFDNDTYRFYYCPNCGVRMDGAE
jgi:hypothetical protein